MNYKGYYIWYNDLQHAWIVQQGYAVLTTCKTIGAAKRAATRYGAEA